MALLAALLLLLPGLGLAAQPTPGPGGEIGFTGTDGNVYSVKPSDATPIRLTNDADEHRTYRQVTWAPDGLRLAFVSYSQGQAGKVNASLHTALRDGSEAREIYSSDTAAPFYLFWAPGSDRVTFLEVAGGSLTLKMVPWRGGPPVSIGSGQPYYWDWMPDGRTLVAHTGGSAADNPQGAAISVLEPGGAGARERSSGPAPASFQAPDIAPDGRSFAAAVFSPGDQNLFVRQGDMSRYLAVVAPEGSVLRTLVRLEGIAAFEWSPDQRRIALVDGKTTPIGGILGPLVLIDAQAGTSQATALEQVSLFSWSPDGKRLVAFVPRIVPAAEPVLLFGVFVVEAATGQARLATVMRPTIEFLSGVVPFYDQYSRSSTFWSPDGSQLVLNAVGEDGRPGIYLLPVEGRGPMRLLAEGLMPFWSPR